MKLILDIDSVKYPLTGIGRYTYELARIFMEKDCFERLVFARGFKTSTDLPSSGETSRSDSEKSFKGRLVKAARKNRLAHEVFLSLRKGFLASSLKSYENFIYHGTNYFLPFFAGPKVVTIHDLSSISVPHFHPKDKVNIINRKIEYACLHADCILTVSEFSKREIVRIMNVAEHKVRVTPNAASKAFYPRSFYELDPVFAKWGLTTGCYTLFVGTIEPRKNIDVLLDAYEGLPTELRRTFPLVLCGYRGWKSEVLHQRIKDLSGKGWVKYLGYADAATLPLLMAGAALFLYPSFYEGFGLPPLEAMQSGVPVIVSDRTSLPEVIGEAGLKLHPQDVDSWKKGIVQGLEDNDWREKTVEQGFKKSASFSWERCASETITAYGELLGSLC